MQRPLPDSILTNVISHLKFKHGNDIYSLLCSYGLSTSSIGRQVGETSRSKNQIKVYFLRIPYS